MNYKKVAIKDGNSIEAVQYVGVYVLDWKKEWGVPEVGFAEDAKIQFDDVKRIWNAAEKYTMHNLGEICKGDATYEENVPDLKTYFKRHYR